MSKHWLQTFNGGAFDLLNPTPEMVDFKVVARALSRIPRFGTHTNGPVPYSVAQHCVAGAIIVERETNDPKLALAFLLHDAHEYVLGDLVTPVVEAITEVSGMGWAVRNGVKEIKQRVDEAIFEAAHLISGLVHEVQIVVKCYDLRMQRTERDLLQDKPPQPWVESIEKAIPLPQEYYFLIDRPWDARTAELEWMVHFTRLRMDCRL